MKQKAKPAGAAATTATGALGAANRFGDKPTVGGKPDINVPVSTYYQQGFKRLQENYEDPELIRKQYCHNIEIKEDIFSLF